MLVAVSGEDGRHDTLSASTVGADAEVSRVLEAPVPIVSILHHPDVRRVGERSWLNDPGSGGRVRLSRTHPAFGARGAPDSAPLRDGRLSRNPSWLEPHADGSMSLHVDADASSVRVDDEPFVGTKKFTSSMLAQGVVLELAQRVVLLLHTVAPVEEVDSDDMELVGHSAAMSAVRAQIRKVGSHDVPVLIRGASGTGKELVAAAIHGASNRADRSYVAVNMATLVPATAASALFGHTRGAFTGASEASEGFFGAADGGTLFLDEIGDTPAEVQPALLRALESGEVQPLGSGVALRRDVRLVAATETDLDRAVTEGRFRLSLLQRLAGYSIHLPALRERRQDIPLLLLHFLRQQLDAVGKLERLDATDKPWLPAALVTGAVLASWEGNVRELRNFAQQLVIDWADAPHIEMDDRIGAVLAPASMRRGADEGAPVGVVSEAQSRRLLRDISEDDVIDALRKHDYRPGPAAEALGVSRSSLYALIDSSPRIRKASELARAEIGRHLELHEGDVRAAARALEVSERGLRLRMRQLGME